MTVYKLLAAIGLWWVQKQTIALKIFNFLLTIFSLYSTTKFVVLWNIPHFPKRLSYHFLAFKGLYTQKKLCNEFLKKLFHETIWIYVEYWPPYINITISLPQKCLPEKSCPDCLRIFIMSWIFKDPIVTVAWLNFDHTQLNIKKWLENIKLP